MATNVGDVQVSLTANTAQFDTGMKQAEATASATAQNITVSLEKLVVVTQRAEAGSRKLAEGMGHTVPPAAAASAAIRTLEGNIGNNIRAAERFIGTLPGLQKLLSAAFPAFGAIALIGVVKELGDRVVAVYEAFQKLQQAPQRIAAAFQALNQPLAVTNAELQVTTDRIENEIAKLQGRPQNGLKIALDEAVLSSLKLSEALRKNFEDLHKLLDQEKVGGLKGFVTGQASDTPLREALFGESGYGGFQGRGNQIAAEYDDRISRARSSAEADGLRRQKAAELERVYGEALQFTTGELEKAERAEAKNAAARQVARATPNAIGTGLLLAAPSQDAYVERLRGVQTNLREEMAQQRLLTRRDDDQKTLDRLQAAANNAKLDQPFRQKVAELEAQVAAARSALSAVGQDETATALAKSFGEAGKAIAEVNSRLAEHHRALTLGQQVEILTLSDQKALLEADTAWKSRLDTVNTSLAERIQNQRLLNAAVGQGIEAQRRAAVEAQLAQVFGPKYAEKRETPEADALRGKLGEEFDLQRAGQGKAAVLSLTDQVVALDRLTEAQGRGLAASREAEIANEQAALAARNATDAEMMLAEARARSQFALQDREAVTDLDRETKAVDLLAGAWRRGVEAQRQAEIQNLRGSGQSQAVIDAQVRQLEARFRLEDIRSGSARAGGTARDGYREFWQEMVDNAKSASAQMKEALGGAFQGVNDQLARLMTGQKTSWAQMLQGLGAQLSKFALENAEVSLGKVILSKGGSGQAGDVWSEKLPGGAGGVLGKLGGLFGLPGAKRDGSTPASAIYVTMEPAAGAVAGGKTGLPGGLLGGGAGSAPASADGGQAGEVWSEKPPGGTGGVLDNLGGLFGRVGGLFGKLFGGFRAEGGAVDLGSAYVVGERGPELFLPPSSGSIVPNHQLGGSTTHVYNIDARGAQDPTFTAVQTKRAILAAHQSAVVTASRIVEERGRRVPQRR